MCGIFCALNIDNYFLPESFNKFKSLTDIVLYRGPDSAKYISFNIKCKTETDKKFDVFLGHRRLSILDLSETGNQPMKVDDLYIIHNGEIFNYLELRKELEQVGERFFSNTDTEVILRLYKKYGSMSFSRLNGMWAFVIVDTQNKKIIVSRDRFSIKPLFFYKYNKKIYFSSEIKQLIPLLDKKNIDLDIIYKFLKQSITDFDDHSFFKEIMKIKPMTNLIIDMSTGEIKEERYWDYEIDEFSNSKSAIFKFKELFLDSIKIRLRSDVEIGALLSGGLDSSAISILANKLSSKRFQTFSIVSEEKKFSEEYFIDLLVRSGNIQNNKIILKSNDIPSKIDDVIFHQDEPFGSFSIIAQYLIFEKIHKNFDIKVVLSGQGGDETMMGYLKYFFFYIDHLRKNYRFDLIIKELLASIINGTVVMQNRLSAAKRYIPYYANKRDDFITINGLSEKTWISDSIRIRQQLDIDKYSVPNLARFEDRNSMAFSIETRLPFLDHRLVNFLLNLKEDLKIKNGWTKYILRSSMPELPKQIRWRKDKRSFLIPEDIWLKEDLAQDIKTIFHNSTLQRLGCINGKKFLEYYDSFINGNRLIHHADISRVYIAEKWARKYFLN